MKKYVTLFIMFTLTLQKGYCEAITPEISDSLKQTSGEPGIMTIIFALAVVIGLIYFTGIIYSKLNLVGSKTLKEQLKYSDINRAIVVSTTQLGQNRNLHVIEINQKNFLIGSTPNSINLITELGANSKKTSVPTKKIQSEEDIDNAIKSLYGKTHDIIQEDTTSLTENSEEEFDVHKKYL